MNNQELAKKILDFVGTRDNVKSVMHCMTRVRFVLKNEKKANDQSIKDLDGVLGVVHSNGQYQVVIGPNVAKVYDEICRIGQFQENEPIEENLDEKIEKKSSLRQIGRNILNYMSSCMTPLIPVLITAGLFKAINAILGPNVLGIYSDHSNIYLLIDFVFNAAFYFLPIFVGITAAKYLGIDSMLGGLLGAILIVPEFVDIVHKGKAFLLFGLPITLVDYSQTVIPIMISVYVLSVIYKPLKKVMPDYISTLVTPFLSMVVAVPLTLFLLAPLGNIIGKHISGGLLAISNATGFLGVAIVAALWPFLVMTGMHLALMMPMLASFFETGQMTGVANAGMFAQWACYGVALGAFLRIENKKRKVEALGYFVSGIIGGVTEPTLYGICFNYKRNFISLMIGSAFGGAFAGLTHVTTYVMSSANFLSVLSFTGGNKSNMFFGIFSMAISFIVSAFATYVIGFKKEEL